MEKKKFQEKRSRTIQKRQDYISAYLTHVSGVVLLGSSSTSNVSGVVLPPTTSPIGVNKLNCQHERTWFRTGSVL